LILDFAFIQKFPDFPVAVRVFCSRCLLKVIDVFPDTKQYQH